MSEEPLKLYVLTFNLACAKVSANDFSFVPGGCDLYALSFQEVGPFVPVVAGKSQKLLTEAFVAHFGPTFSVVCDETMLALKLFIVVHFLERRVFSRRNILPNANLNLVHYCRKLKRHVLARHLCEALQFPAKSDSLVSHVFWTVCI
jgi:hypothetical protein